MESIGTKNKVSTTTKLQNDHVGHMVEYLAQNLYLKDIPALERLVDRHLAQNLGEDLENADVVKKEIQRDRDVVEGSWEPDFYVVCELRDEHYALIHRVIYPVEVKANNTPFERNQGTDFRKYSKTHLGESVKLSINTAELPRKLDCTAKTLKHEK